MGGSLTLFTHTSRSPLSRVFALLKDSINLKWTKESSKKIPPVFPSLPYIQLFSTPVPFCPICSFQLFLIFLFLNVQQFEEIQQERGRTLCSVNEKEK